MKAILNQTHFDFISQLDKAFILAFNDEMEKLGYTFGDKIGSGYCWGKYMLIYTKAGVKSKRVYARIYIRDTSILLRLFLSDIDKHRGYIEKTPSHIKNVFLKGFGDCKHDKDDQDGKCMFRKTYTIDNQIIEKCNGFTFEFSNPNLEKIGDYVDLFTEFYPQGKKTSLNIKHI